MKSNLPNQFKNLEQFSGWILKNDRARNLKRLASSMPDIRKFYDAMLPQLDSIMEYLNQFPLDGMPEEAQNLCYLTLSLAEVTPAVENFGQPTVPDAFDSTRLVRLNHDLLEVPD